MTDSRQRLVPQAAFHMLLTRHVEPLLRAQGYRGSGGTYRQRAGANWLVVNVQRSMANTADEVRFTINLGVASARLLAAHGLDPHRPPSIWDCHWRQRIGNLLPERNDVWWRIDADTDVESLAQTLLEHLREHALPGLEACADDEALRRLWESGVSPGLTETQRLRYLAHLEKPHTASE